MSELKELIKYGLWTEPVKEQEEEELVPQPHV
jgi:hypothetical protein